MFHIVTHFFYVCVTHVTHDDPSHDPCFQAHRFRKRLVRRTWHREMPGWKFWTLRPPPTDGLQPGDARGGTRFRVASGDMHSRDVRRAKGGLLPS